MCSANLAKPMRWSSWRTTCRSLPISSSTSARAWNWWRKTRAFGVCPRGTTTARRIWSFRMTRYCIARTSFLDSDGFSLATSGPTWLPVGLRPIGTTGCANPINVKAGPVFGPKSVALVLSVEPECPSTFFNSPVDTLTFSVLFSTSYFTIVSMSFIFFSVFPSY